MSKFTNVPMTPTSPIATTGISTRTYEGGLGFERDAKSELFLLAVTNLVGEDTFYESAGDRDKRFADLVHEVTRTDPAWIARFVPYLRNELFLRSCPLVMAAEYVVAGGPHGRAVVASALQRADEPAEMLAYWRLVHGRNIPQPVKRGVADAVTRLYNERAALRYDGTASAWRMGDVIDIVHPTPSGPWQSDLFKFLLDKRHNRAAIGVGNNLKVIVADRDLMATPEAERRSLIGNISDAGWSWERLSGWLPGGMDAQAWEAVIPTMGYMAVLRNLRNFDQANISSPIADAVARRLSDPDEIAKSKQMPFRFLSAWKSVAGMRWGQPLETALDLSMSNVPSLPGRTLVAIDVSQSMAATLSAKSTVSRIEVAGILGVTMAKRCNADLVLFATEVGGVTITPRSATLRVMDEIATISRTGQLGGGTNMHTGINAAFNGHDRVIVVSDDQAQDSRIPLNPAIKRLYTFNVAGYRAAHTEFGKNGRFEFGGLTDAGFKMLSILERQTAGWPF